MSIGKKNKSHLKEHGGVVLVAPVVALASNDPLRFWTRHPTEITLVELHPFADGEFQNPHPTGGGNWGGSYTGRPKLIEELAPALEARSVLLSYRSIAQYLSTLRAWWRLFDSIEASPGPDGVKLARVESLADLNSLHEAAAHRSGMKIDNFRTFLSIVNTARKLHAPRLPNLLWEPPNHGDPVRLIPPEDQARAIKVAIKQDWERVRRTWARNDSLRAEIECRAACVANSEWVNNPGEFQPALQDEDERLIKNLQHLLHIQQETGNVLPTGVQLLDGNHRVNLWERGIEVRVMRAILFPTVEEADIAFLLVLMNSGWNPSTVANMNGSSPILIFGHPKDTSQTVLSVDDEDEEVTMQADKPRARGKTQFCIGLKKHTSSPPAVVAAYLQRVAPLREQLISDYREACAELAQLESSKASEQAIAHQYKLAQKLSQGCNSVWLYVDTKGKINWLNSVSWKRYKSGDGSKTPISYLDQVLRRVNSERVRHGQSPIASVKPSDFRDIYARWVYVKTGGNILAVMLALGHSSLKSTGQYLDNNIFSAENDEHAGRFMTHLFAELKQGRVDLAILAQLVHHGPLTVEMLARLTEYRKLMLSRVGVACTDPRHPPTHIAPDHHEGSLCGSQRCLRDCGNARFLPESLDGLAMRAEELYLMSDLIPRETWLRGGFQDELEDGECLLDTLFPPKQVAEARENWRGRIARGEHVVPSVGIVTDTERDVA